MSKINVAAKRKQTAFLFDVFVVYFQKTSETIIFLLNKIAGIFSLFIFLNKTTQIQWTNLKKQAQVVQNKIYVWQIN